MELLEAIKAKRVPIWMRFANSPFELNISKLSTVEMQRLSRKALKHNKLDSERLLELTYPQVIRGMRGMTLQLLEEKLGLEFPDNLTRDGQTISKQDVIASDPIDSYWLSFLIGVGKTIPKFHFWINEVSGQSAMDIDEEDDEEQKKT